VRSLTIGKEQLHSEERKIQSCPSRKANFADRRPTYPDCPFPPCVLQRLTYARVRAIVRRACAARVFRSPLSELVVSDDPPRTAYDSNSNSSNAALAAGK